MKNRWLCFKLGFYWDLDSLDRLACWSTALFRPRMDVWLMLVRHNVEIGGVW